MENKTRQEGYYWIKVDNQWVVGLFSLSPGTMVDGTPKVFEKWTISAYLDDSWNITPEEIDENRIVRLNTIIPFNGTFPPLKKGQMAQFNGTSWLISE